MADYTLRPCFFSGVPFFFESISSDCGRRLSVNDLPFQSNPFIEDMGQYAGKIAVEGYIVGKGATPFKDAQNQKNALQNAFNKKGKSILELPFFAERLQAVCEGATFSYDGSNRIAFSFTAYSEIKEQPLINTTQYSLLSSQRCEIAMLRFISKLQGIVSDFYDVTKTFLTAAYAIRNINIMVDGFKGYLNSLFDALLFENDDDKKRIRENLDGIDDRDYVSCIAVLSEIAVAPKAGKNIDPITGANITPITGGNGNTLSSRNIDAFLDALNYEPVTFVYPATRIVSKTKRQDAINQIMITHAFKQCLIIAYANQIAQETFATKEQAIFHRANLSDRIDAESPYPIDDTFEYVTDVTNNAATYLTEVITTLSPIVTVSGGNEALPAAWWAYRLYGNLDNMQDLIERNNVIDPDFMPVEFKAIAWR